MRSSTSVDEWIENTKIVQGWLYKKFPDWWDKEVVRKRVLLDTRKRFGW